MTQTDDPSWGDVCEIAVENFCVIAVKRVDVCSHQESVCVVPVKSVCVIPVKRVSL